MNPNTQPPEEITAAGELLANHFAGLHTQLDREAQAFAQATVAFTQAIAQTTVIPAPTAFTLLEALHHSLNQLRQGMHRLNLNLQASTELEIIQLVDHDPTTNEPRDPHESLSLADREITNLAAALDAAFYYTSHAQHAIKGQNYKPLPLVLLAPSTTS